MKNKNFSLQLLTHKQLFATREDAITYFEDNFKPYALIGEPAIAFYGEEKSPKAIIAIGTSTDKRIFFIDTNELSEKVISLENLTEQEEKEISNSVALIKDIINACGLTLDENKKSDRVTYDSDSKDEILSDAKSLSEAIDLISKFVQKGFKENELNTENSDTIKLTCTTSENSGKLLKAEVKISNYGENDDIDFNDNIICKKDDGIYATSNLDYDSEKHLLIFTSSGYKDGKYKDDAHKKTINLEEHSSISVENDNHNIALTINKIDGSNKYIISGDIVLSENSHNILEIENNALLVKGIAGNIQYADTTVDKELDNINKEIETASEKITNLENNLKIEGNETDTVTTAIKKLSQGFSISSNVKLSTDGSIKVSDGGISTVIDVTVNNLTNTLTLKNGTREKTVTLPGIEIVKNIYYDDANAVLVIEFNNSSNPLKIPVADMIETIDVQNNTDSAIELHKHAKEGVTGKSYISGSVKIRTNDNLLEKDSNNGELYVTKSAITNEISTETNRAISTEKELQSNININAKNINDEIARAKDVESELRNADTTINAELSVIKNNLEIESTKRETFDNSIQAIVNENSQSIIDLNSSLNSVKNNLTDEINNRTLAETKINNSISTNTSEITKESKRALESEQRLSDTIVKNKEEFDLFKDTTNTSIQQLKDSDTQIKENITDKVTIINSEISLVKNNVDNITKNLANEINRAKEAEKNNADDILSNNQKIESNSKQITDINNAYKVADTELKTELNKEITRATTSEVSLTNQLNTEVNRATAEEALLLNKINDNKNSIIEENNRAIKAENELSTKLGEKIGKVEIKKNSASDLQYTLYVDEKPCGDINIPEDQFLKSVSYDSSAKVIHFIFKTTDGEIYSDINVSDLIDTYIAGNGLDLNENKFSVKINEGTEDFITVNENGIKIVGINAELDKKANIGDSYTKLESDSKFLTSHQDVSNLATKNELQTLSDKLSNTEVLVSKNSDAIDIINGNEATEGSIKKAINDANTYTDNKVNDNLFSAGNGLALNNKTFEVKKADGSQKYLEVISDGVKIVGVDEELVKKADKTDVYTIEQIDNKGYLTSHQDISNLAKKTDVDTISNKLNDEINRASAEEKLIYDKINDNFTKSSFTVNKTNTINLIKETNTDGSSLLTANVEVSNLNGNLIKTDQPLYASVDLSYDEGTNTLKFISSALNEAKEIKLNVGSIIDKIIYEDTSEEIVITYTNANGEKGEVRFSVRTLFNKLTVQNDNLGAIILSKETKNGNDILSGKVVVSSLSTNALINDNGSLYVSNQAKDYKLADDTSIESSISNIKASINTLTDNVSKIPSISVANTTTVVMNAEYIDTQGGLQITSNVKVDNNEDNLITTTENGLFVNGIIDYGLY